MKIWRYPLSATLLINCYWDCLWLTLPLIWSEFACSSNYLSLNTIALSSLIQHLIVFHCPLADLNTACFFFFGSTVLPPAAQLFKKCRGLQCHFYQGFRRLNRCSFMSDNLFLVLESTLIFQRSFLFKV
jgi:hypothetical protein